MKKTLLEIVQSILNDLDSDEVNSIDDTIESQQVAQIVRDCYDELIANRNWPHLRKLSQFEAVSLEKPSHLKIPLRLKELTSFKYDVIKSGETKLQYKDIKFLQPEEFLHITSQRNSTLSNVLTVTDFSGTPLLIYNNKAPQYYTSFDDVYIVCDSYDRVVDDTLKKAKTQILCYTFPDWQHTNTFIPDLPEEAFPLLIEEAKSTAFIVLKQAANQKAEQKAARQNRWLSRKAWSVSGGVQYPNYGRKGKK